MPYKTVNLPIRVPEGKYCWEWFGESPAICPFFSNDGGFRRCDLHLGKLVTTDDGILKPEECNSLLESEGRK